MQAAKHQSAKKDAAQTLIKSLAHHEKKVRDKSVRILQQWLKSKSEISELELLKIWKALFFCMWHSDKPLIQQELAERLSKLINCLPSFQKAMLYLRTFFITIQREWLIIDRLRLNKYYTLVRQMVRSGLAYLRERQWEVERVQSFVDVIAAADGPLSAACPVGVTLHLVDLFVDELLAAAGATEHAAPAPAAAASISGASAAVLLAPFVELLATTADDAIANRVRERVFEPLLVQHASRLPALEPRRIAEAFFTAASAEHSVSRTRKLLYQLHRTWAAQQTSADTVDSAQDGADGTDAAVPPKKKNKKEKQPSVAEVPQEAPVPADNGKKDQNEKKQKKKKKKKQKKNETSLTTAETLTTSPPAETPTEALSAEVEHEGAALTTPPTKKSKKQNQQQQSASTPSSSKKRPPTPFKQLVLSPGSEDGRLVQQPVEGEGEGYAATTTPDANGTAAPPFNGTPAPHSPSLKSKSRPVSSKRKSVQFGGVDMAHFPKNSSPTVITEMRRAAMYDPAE